MDAAGALLAVKDDRQAVAVHRLDTMEPITSLDASADHHHWYGGLAFHPAEHLLALTSDRDRRVAVYEHDRDLVSRSRREASAPAYVNCRVALLGESGVGKTSLVRALRGEAFEPTESTHATKTALMHRETAGQDGHEVVREVYLWDLAGQPAYRLLQHLDVTGVELALLVFDNRSATEPLKRLREWDVLLRQWRPAHTAPRRILVAARADRGGTPVPMCDLLRDDVLEGSWTRSRHRPKPATAWPSCARRSYGRSCGTGCP